MKMKWRFTCGHEIEIAEGEVLPVPGYGYMCPGCESARKSDTIWRGRAISTMEDMPETAEEILEDAIRSPDHYTRGIESWDFICSHSMGFLEGNIIKYLTRYRLKEGIKDLRKARAYIDRLIKECEDNDPSCKHPH